MYYVMRVEKRKKSDISGLQNECNRTMTSDKYNNKVQIGMDIFNIDLRFSDNWLRDINQVISDAGAKTRKNSVVGLDAVYSASPEFFKINSNDTALKFFNDCLKFHEENYGKVISAVIHYDETTPHLHVMSVPITADGRLSARDIVGNQKKLSNNQTRFFEEVGKGFGLERGEIRDSSNKRQHITAQEHRITENNKQLRKQAKQLERIERQLSNSLLQIEERQSKLNDLNCKISERENFLETVNLTINSQRKKLKRCLERVKALQPYLTRAERREIEDILDQSIEDR